MKCSCSDWEPNTEILNAFVQMSVIHGMADYKAQNGKVFVFCPWCGVKLEEEASEESM